MCLLKPRPSEKCEEKQSPTRAIFLLDESNVQTTVHRNDYDYATLAIENPDHTESETTYDPPRVLIRFSLEVNRLILKGFKVG